LGTSRIVGSCPPLRAAKYAHAVLLLTRRTQ
jgi:hypothetical protein